MAGTPSKKCTQCKKTKPLATGFRLHKGRKRSGTAYHSICRQCEQENHKRWKERNPERVAATARRSWLMRSYGITPEQYDELVAQQNGACATCLRSDLPLVVDHCHVTERVRGLLCNPCNSGIGHFREDREAMARAIRYLEANMLDPVRSDPWPLTSTEPDSTRF